MGVQIAPTMAASQRDDFVHPERYPDYFAKYSTQMHYKGFPNAILSTIRQFLSQDNAAAFAQVGKSGKPMLLIWGRADQDVPFALSDECAKRSRKPNSMPSMMLLTCPSTSTLKSSIRC